MSDDPEPQVLEALREFNYRQLMPMTHEDYLNELDGILLALDRVMALRSVPSRAHGRLEDTRFGDVAAVAMKEN